MTSTIRLRSFLNERLSVICNTIVSMGGELVYEASFLHLHSKHKLLCRKSGDSTIIECCTCNEVLVDVEEVDG
jgi:hypothetical protein